MMLMMMINDQHFGHIHIHIHVEHKLFPFYFLCLYFSYVRNHFYPIVPLHFITQTFSMTFSPPSFSFFSSSLNNYFHSCFFFFWWFIFLLIRIGVLTACFFLCTIFVLIEFFLTKLHITWWTSPPPSITSFTQFIYLSSWFCYYPRSFLLFFVLF